jgi:hypothetical protein
VSAPLHRPEPTPPSLERAGFVASDGRSLLLLEASATLVQQRVPGIAGLLAAGSHAAGEAVWASHSGRWVSLSDLDLYAILDGEASRRQAQDRFRRERPDPEELFAIGLAAPLEVAFLTAAGLARLPARPGTLALRRYGCLLRGRSGWLELVPEFAPADIAAEEIALLIENRAFELLAAWPDLDAARPLARLQARHAILKTALDLARAAALRAGELPPRARDLAEWWRAHAASGAELEPLLATAVAWRRSGAVDAPVEVVRREWDVAAACWTRAWRALGPGEVDPARLVLRRARRARLRRRLRQALHHPVRSGLGPELRGRLRHALAGTPQHRVNASAALLLLAATEGSRADAAAGPAEAGRVPILQPWAARTLAALGVVSPKGRADWARAAREVVRAWDCWMLDGQRTAERE